MEDDVVYYGSSHRYEKKEPHRSVRTREEDGREVIIFDEVCFHASPFRWVALSYTYDRKYIRAGTHSVAVSLYSNEKVVYVYGPESLDHSLEELFGGGGFVHVFDAKHFYSAEGLGTLDVVTKKTLTPIRIERVNDPVSEMQAAGIQFEFEYVDAKPS